MPCHKYPTCRLVSTWRINEWMNERMNYMSNQKQTGTQMWTQMHTHTPSRILLETWVFIFLSSTRIAFSIATTLSEENRNHDRILFHFCLPLSPPPNNQQHTNRNLLQICVNSADLEGSPGTGTLTRSLGDYKWQAVPKNYFVPLCARFPWEPSPEQPSLDVINSFLFMTVGCPFGKPSPAQSQPGAHPLSASPLAASLENVPHGRHFSDPSSRAISLKA